MSLDDLHNVDGTLSGDISPKQGFSLEESKFCETYMKLTDKLENKIQVDEVTAPYVYNDLGVIACVMANTPGLSLSDSKHSKRITQPLSEQDISSVLKIVEKRISKLDDGKIEKLLDTNILQKNLSKEITRATEFKEEIRNRISNVRDTLKGFNPYELRSKPLFFQNLNLNNYAKPSFKIDFKSKLLLFAGSLLITMGPFVQNLAQDPKSIRKADSITKTNQDPDDGDIDYTKLLTRNITDDKGMGVGHSPDTEALGQNETVNKLYSSYKNSAQFNALDRTIKADFIKLMSNINTGTESFSETARILDATESILNKIDASNLQQHMKESIKGYVVDEIGQQLESETMKLSTGSLAHKFMRKVTLKSHGTEGKINGLTDNLEKNIEACDIKAIRDNAKTLIRELRNVDFLPFNSQGVSYDSFELLENELLQSLMLLDKRYYHEHVKDDGSVSFKDKREISSKKDLYNLLGIPDQTKLLEDSRSTGGLHEKVSEVITGLKKIGRGYEAQRLEKLLNKSFEKREALFGSVLKKFFEKGYNNQNDLLVIGSLRQNDKTIAKHVNTLSHLHRAMGGFHDIHVDAKATPYDSIGNLYKHYKQEQERGTLDTNELVISIDAHGAMTGNYAKGQVHTILGFEKGFAVPYRFAQEASKISEEFGIDVTILINTCRNILSGDKKNVSPKLENGANNNVTIVFSAPPDKSATSLKKGNKQTIAYATLAMDAMREINPGRLLSPSDLKSSVYGSINKILGGKLYSPTQVLKHKGNFIEVPLELENHQRYEILAAALEKHLANQ